MDVEKWLNNYYPVARTITKQTVVELIKRAIAQDREEREKAIAEVILPKDQLKYYKRNVERNKEQPMVDDDNHVGHDAPGVENV